MFGLEVSTKKLALIITAFIIIFASVYFLFFDTKKPIREIDERYGESKNEIDENFKKLIQSNDKTNYGRPMIYRDGCENIADAKEKQLCFDNENFSKARTNSDLKSCDKITDNFGREYCYSRVTWDKNDISGCSLIKDGSLKEQCISDLAIKNLDKTICGKLNEGNEKKECEAVTDAFIIEQKYSSDIQKCFTIPQVKEYRHHCILTLTQRKGPDICNSLNIDEKNECSSTYLLFLGISQNNINLCSEIVLDDYKKVCLKTINYKGSQSELDSDKDGLDDVNEIRNGTKPFNPDSDSDALVDGEEMFKYHTDSLSADTDKDGYLDGEEVKNGYDPNGPGKLVQ